MSEDNVETREQIHSGVSIMGEITRGEATRDQDKLRLKGKGANAEEAIEEFEETLQAAEENRWADRLRALQPDEDEEEEADDAN